MLKAAIQRQHADVAVSLVFDMMAAAMKAGERIEIRGFGVFTVRAYEGYQGRNPKTGEVVSVPAKRAPRFRVGKELRERVDLPKKAP